MLTAKIYGRNGVHKVYIIYADPAKHAFVYTCILHNDPGIWVYRANLMALAFLL